MATYNFYEYFAQNLPLFRDRIERVFASTMLTYTPYLFAEPVDFKAGVTFKHPAQLNIPSPDTMLMFDWLGKPMMVIMDSAKLGIGLFSRGTDEDNNVGVSLLWQGKMTRPTENHAWDLVEFRWLSVGDVKPKPPSLEIMVNMLLVHCNTMTSNTLISRLSRQQQRACARSLGYPLKATTEITITPKERPRELIHATGEGPRKCLHSVKGHPRTYHRNTPLEVTVWVKPHDRGDPALGLKKTKYRVETRA